MSGLKAVTLGGQNEDWPAPADEDMGGQFGETHAGGLRWGDGDPADDPIEGYTVSRPARA
jgi:hypothetical protein